MNHNQKAIKLSKAKTILRRVPKWNKSMRESRIKNKLNPLRSSQVKKIRLSAGKIMLKWTHKSRMSPGLVILIIEFPWLNDKLCSTIFCTSNLPPSEIRLSPFWTKIITCLTNSSMVKPKNTMVKMCESKWKMSLMSLN